jgi:hypothetical protein
MRRTIRREKIKNERLATAGRASSGGGEQNGPVVGRLLSDPGG